MVEILEELSILRDPAFLYFVRDADVWRIRRVGADRRAERVAATTHRPDPAYIHFLDGAGHLARTARRPAPRPGHRQTR